MPTYVGDYLAETQKLSRDQHGAYLLLRFAYWTDGGLPDDDRVLASLVKASVTEWRTILRPIIEKFFVVQDGMWMNQEIEEYLEKAQRRRDMAKHAIAHRDFRSAAYGPYNEPYNGGNNEPKHGPYNGGNNGPNIGPIYDTRNQSKYLSNLDINPKPARPRGNGAVEGESEENQVVSPRARSARLAPSAPNRGKNPPSETSETEPYPPSFFGPNPPSKTAVLKKDQLVQKVMRFAQDTMPKDAAYAAYLGLMGDDPGHPAQWWLDTLDRAMKAQRWDDAHAR